MSPKAAYRRVGKYYKTSSQYWKERSRRKLVLRLHEEEHLSCGQIAERLKVSVRTVNRDLAKIKPYYERRIRHYRDELRKEGSNSEVEEAAFEARSLREQLDILRVQWKSLKELVKQQNRPYTRHQIQFILNLDEIINGLPSLKILPDVSRIQMKTPITISIVCLKDKKATIMAQTTLNLS